MQLYLKYSKVGKMSEPGKTFANFCSKGVKYIFIGNVVWF